MSGDFHYVITIGRGLNNGVVMADPSVSKRHATVKKDGEQYWIVDLSSSNGTYVNGRRISEAKLFLGDIVNFGQVQTEFDGKNLRILDKSDVAFLLDHESNTDRSKARRLTFLLVLCIAFVIILFVFIQVNSKAVSSNQIARATVKIVMKDSSGNNCWSGSGALILDGRFVVTNAHVAAFNGKFEEPGLSGCKFIAIGLSNASGLNTEEYVSGLVAAIDLERDLAIIKLEKSIQPSVRKPLSIRSSDISLEEKLRVFGYPFIGGESLTVSEGIVSGLDQAQKFSFFKVTADISSGSSGGPVVDTNGQLVGIASAINRQEIDCSSGSRCYAEGNGLGLVRPISLLKALVLELK